ncbi:MAG TPA: TlpA disulfide reductase family protein [Flavisolibacter sp.]|nr:TlpA disulfide reductase family protein [Flavisolibacter sp.]
MKLFFSILFFVSSVLCVQSHATDIHITTSDQQIKNVRIEPHLKYFLHKEPYASKSIITATLLGKGKIHCSFNTAEPAYMQMVLNDSIYTDPFFIDNRATHIEIHIKEDLSLNIVGSKTHDEYKTVYVPAIAAINQKIQDFFVHQYNPTFIKYNGQLTDSTTSRFENVRSQLRENRFQEMQYYILKYPDSYVAMWKQLEDILSYGYKAKLEEGYHLFSEKIKQSPLGQAVAEVLKEVKGLTPGNSFPNLTVSNIDLKPVQLKSNLKGRYILIDFWYSNCFPCIEQFPDLKGLYQKYSRDQFEILFVSIDKYKDLPHWKKIIAKYELPFPQFVDIDGKLVSSQLNIIKYPSNFLLDQSGTILQKDISPGKLKAFLEAQLQGDTKAVNASVIKN